jgi:hypothetical protein
MAWSVLFHFRLRSLAQVTPFGTHRPTLHWFGLTDGWYWLELDGQQLFRFSQPWLDARRQPGDASPWPYVGSPVAGLWEAVLEGLSDFLQPVPADLATLVRTAEQRRAWTAWLAAGSQPAPSGVRYDFAVAGEWWRVRRLAIDHLPHSPALWIWREADTLHLQWDNADVVDGGGRLVWSATQGAVVLPLETLLAEVRSFHERLMAEMGERVAEARGHWPRPDVAIDLDRLVHEHSHLLAPYLDRCLALAVRGLPPALPSWDETRQALARLQRYETPPPPS